MTASIHWIGLTKENEPSPQRIDLGKWREWTMRLRNYEPMHNDSEKQKQLTAAGQKVLGDLGQRCLRRVRFSASGQDLPIDSSRAGPATGVGLVRCGPTLGTRPAPRPRRCSTTPRNVAPAGSERTPSGRAHTRSDVPVAVPEW